MRRKAAGTHARMVLSKQGVRYGLSAFKVKLSFHRAPPHNPSIVEPYRVSPILMYNCFKPVSPGFSVISELFVLLTLTQFWWSTGWSTGWRTGCRRSKWNSHSIRHPHTNPPSLNLTGSAQMYNFFKAISPGFSVISISNSDQDAFQITYACF